MGHPFSQRAQDLRTLNSGQAWPRTPASDVSRRQAGGVEEEGGRFTLGPEALR